MKTTRRLFLLSFVILVTACKGITTLTPGGDLGQLDPNQVEKATNQFCRSDQKLAELQDGTDVPFGQLNYRSRVFAFVNNDTSKKCIIEQSINQNWPENGTWLNLNPNDNCLPNGSLWEVVQSTASGNGQYYSLVMYGDKNARIMNMNGHQAIRGTYLRDNLGLRILYCVNN